MLSLKVPPRHLKRAVLLILFVLIFFVLWSKTGSRLRSKIDFRQFIRSQELLERKNWNDFKLMVNEAHRVGPGEKGQPVVLTDPRLIAEGKKLLKKHGFNALISDIISPDRSLPDVRLDR
jgi:hypothetical protein